LYTYVYIHRKLEIAALVLLKLFINSNIKQRDSVASLGFIEAVHQQQYKAAYQRGKPWFY